MRMKRQNWQLATEQESTWATSYTMSADGGGRDDNEQARAQDQPCHVVLSSQIPPIGTGLFRVKQSRQPTGTTNAVMLPRLPDLSDDLTVDLVSFLNVQETRTLMLVNRRYRSLLQGGNENDQTSALGRTVWKEHAMRHWPWLKQELNFDNSKHENGAYSRLHFATRTASPSQLLAMAQGLPHEQMEIFDVRNNHHHAQGIMSALDGGESFRRLLQRFSLRHDDSEYIYTVPVTDEPQDWSNDDCSETNHPITATTTHSRTQRLYFQYRGRIGRGNRCIRANAPLPRPTWPSLPSSMVPTASSLLLDNDNNNNDDDDDDDNRPDDTSDDNDDDGEDDTTTTTTTTTTANTAREAFWPPIFQHFGTVRTMNNPTPISCMFRLPSRPRNHPAEANQHLLRPFCTPLLRRHGTGTIAHIAPRVVSYFEVSILAPIVPANGSNSQNPLNRQLEREHEHGARRWENDPPRHRRRQNLWHENASSRSNNRTKADCIAVGIGMNAFAWHCRMPGWDNYSIGYHSDNGGLYCGSGRSIRPTYGPTFGPGDVVGCGIDSIEQTIFFTCNGVFLGDAWQFETAWLQQEETFPVVGLDSHGLVHCNFSGPFVFDLDHYTSEKGYEEFIVKAMRPSEIPSV